MVSHSGIAFITDAGDLHVLPYQPTRIPRPPHSAGGGIGGGGGAPSAAMGGMNLPGQQVGACCISAPYQK